jgi:ligand-binding SRPBCC domain-containing protein
MPFIQVQTKINADLEVCFDLARSIDFHKESLKHTDEIPIAGKTTGLIELGEWVSWEARHLGFVQHLTTKITEFESPNYFVGEMIFGAFKSLKHEHVFKGNGIGTIMIDKFYFESPYGFIGKFANWLFLKKYMSKLLAVRNSALKNRAEIEQLKRNLKQKNVENYLYS